MRCWDVKEHRKQSTHVNDESNFKVRTSKRDVFMWTMQT